MKNSAARISIIIPTLNEATTITDCLQRLAILRRYHHEVIVVDGGSEDNTFALARPLCDKIFRSSPLRSLQMNTGAEHAQGEYLLFLHADTHLPEDIDQFIGLFETDEKLWGRFDIRLSGTAWIFRVIEACINFRSRLSGIATGDQAIFVHKSLFRDVDGFPNLPLMEDIALSVALKKITRPTCLHLRVISSSRRWERHGVVKTIVTMWSLRLLYFLGYDVIKLARHYR